MLPTISNPMVRNIFRNIDCDITLPLNNGCDKDIDFDFGEKPTGNEGLSGYSKYNKVNPLSNIKEVISDPYKLGVFLMLLGFKVSQWAMLMFFETNLLRIGNVMIILGLMAICGPLSTIKFLSVSARIIPALVTLLGIILVTMGKPKIGIFVEILGFLTILNAIVPTVWATFKERNPFLANMVSSLPSMLGQMQPQSRPNPLF